MIAPKTNEIQELLGKTDRAFEKYYKLSAIY